MTATDAAPAAVAVPPLEIVECAARSHGTDLWGWFEGPMTSPAPIDRQRTAEIVLVNACRCLCGNGCCRLDTAS